MSEYYQFQDIIVRFDVFEDGEKVRPDKATVVIYDPENEYIGTDAARIRDSEVRYILKGEQVLYSGKYIFVFRIRVSQLGEYTHVVNIHVEKSPVPNNK